MTINRNALKNYAPKARREFIAAVTARAAKFGITEGDPAPVQEQGDVVVINGEAFPKRIGEQRKKLLMRIRLHGFQQTMEEVAYTWFNRFLAIRFMELHGYLDHGYRALSHPDGRSQPEILEHAEHLDFPGLDKAKVVDLKLDGTKDAELYRMLLIAQCNALHRAMPFLFESIDDETEILLPDNLLHSDSLIRGLVGGIDEADWAEIEIIGWLYQFYISEKKDQVIGKVVKSEDIPAATQLFTPNWIVKYMVENSLGAQWLATYPGSSLKGEMEYYIEPAEQTEEVQQRLAEITPKELNPEELTLIDPACGSGHILVEAYDLFKSIYLERGYRLRDIPRLILEKNLYGLDIDDRAAQMAGFALLMKARADDPRILAPDNPPLMHVMAILDSKGVDTQDIVRTLLPKGRYELVPSDDLLPDTVAQPVLSAQQVGKLKPHTIRDLIELFADAKTFGSLITVPNEVAQALPALETLIEPDRGDDLYQREAKLHLRPMVEQAVLLGRRYDAVVANPPYLGMAAANRVLKQFISTNYPEGKIDLYSSFIIRCHNLSRFSYSMVVQHSWMFLARFEALRNWFLGGSVFLNVLHLGPRAFEAISGEVVQSAAFSARTGRIPDCSATFVDLTEGNYAEKQTAFNSKSAMEFQFPQDRFAKIPRSNFVYWASPTTVKIFEDSKPLEMLAKPRHGMVTSDNERFLRQWPEVNFARASLNCDGRDSSVETGAKWFPYNKGGGNRKWFGHNDIFVNWQDDGREIIDLAAEKYGSASRQIQNTKYYFKEGITWSSLSSESISMRANGIGFLFDSKGNSMFFDPGIDISLFLALCNSSVAAHFMRMLAPTLDFNAGAVAKLPVPEDILGTTGYSPSLPEGLVKLSKLDWDSFESSWDFAQHPLVAADHHQDILAKAYDSLRANWNELTSEAQRLAEENNRIFINAYGLQDELTSGVPLRDVTLTCNPYYRYGGDLTDEEREQRLRANTMHELISYAVGCMMGRYSLAEEGLIYANSGNEGFDPSRYGVFSADHDGIVPITEIEWFDDDAAVRFEEFLKVAWSPEMLRVNLRFMAESLASNGRNDPQKTIRNYFAKSFFKDHMKSYKKRPIYWLFSSGKQKAFECLLYLHRYNESTLSRMRMEYVTPLQSRIAARIEQLSEDVETASSSVERNRKQKEKDKLVKQLEELRGFDEELRHFADQRISLDLNDGVKVNYSKFGNLLAERKAITGEK